MEKGQLTFAKALVVARRATPWTVTERIEEAARTSCVQLERKERGERERKQRARGEWAIGGPKEAVEVVSLAIATAKRVCAAFGETIDSGEALALIADHFVLVWVHHEEAAKAAKRGPKRRKRKKGEAASAKEDRLALAEEMAERLLAKLFPRNYGFCEFPRCSRPARHRHHINFRSHGGGDEEGNICFLCTVHHLQGVHHGFLKVLGRSGEEITWIIGREEASQEVWRTGPDGEAVRECG